MGLPSGTAMQATPPGTAKAESRLAEYSPGLVNDGHAVCRRQRRRVLKKMRVAGDKTPALDTSNGEKACKESQSLANMRPRWLSWAVSTAVGRMFTWRMSPANSR